MTNEIPEEITPEAQAQLKSALDTALAKPQAAQGFLNKIPDLSAVGPKVAQVLDTVIEAVETVLEYKWVIPDQYEAPIEKLLSALQKVRGWLG